MRFSTSTEPTGSSPRADARPALRLMTVTAAVAVLLLFGSMAQAAPEATAAGFEQATAQCWSGPSGNACARLFYNASTRVWRGYGAVDPNPGRSISLYTLYLYQCSTPTSGCRLVSTKAGAGGPSNVYQRLTTDGSGPPCYWFSEIAYGAAGRNYLRRSPIGGRC